MRALVTFFLIAPIIVLAGTFTNAQTCLYDQKTQEFHFNQNLKIGLTFGRHGNPNFTREYSSSGKAHLASEIRSLIEKHSETLPEMNSTFDRTLLLLSKQNVSWIGYEASQADIDSTGGLNGIMTFLRNEDLRLQRLGFKETERRDYMMIMIDPIVAAQYWHRHKRGKSEPGGPAATGPVVIGFDNQRDDEMTALSKKVYDILVKYDDLRGALDEAKLGVPSWILGEFNEFKLGRNLMNSPHKAVDFVRKTLSDPRASGLNTAQRKRIESLRDHMAANADFLQQTLVRGEKEFAKRDQGIAEDLSKSAILRGFGIAHIGKDHEPGVIAKLIKLCTAATAPSDRQNQRWQPAPRPVTR